MTSASLDIRFLALARLTWDLIAPYALGSMLFVFWPAKFCLQAGL